MNTRELTYRSDYGLYGAIIGVIGIAGMGFSAVNRIEQIRYRNISLDFLPYPWPNVILFGIGLFLLLLTIHNLLKTKAFNSNQKKIVLGDQSFRFTRVEGYKGVLTEVNYHTITAVNINTDSDEEEIKIHAPSMGLKYAFDADDFLSKGDYQSFVDEIKKKADQATIKISS